MGQGVQQDAVAKESGAQHRLTCHILQQRADRREKFARERSVLQQSRRRRRRRRRGRGCGDVQQQMQHVEVEIEQAGVGRQRTNQLQHSGQRGHALPLEAVKRCACRCRCRWRVATVRSCTCICVCARWEPRRDVHVRPPTRRGVVYGRAESPLQVSGRRDDDSAPQLAATVHRGALRTSTRTRSAGG